VLSLMCACKAVAVFLAVVVSLPLLLTATPVCAADVTIGPNGGLMVDGKPFFPISVWLQPLRLVDFHKDLGINTFMAEGAQQAETATQFLDALEARGMYGIVHFSQANLALRDHPALLTWMYGDEPDLTSPGPFEMNPLQGQTVLIEAEKPRSSTFPGRTWLVKQSAQLSGGTWLSETADNLPAEPFVAAYDVQIPADGKYILWDRGFMKSWSSPTRWRLDAGEWHTTDRALKTIESRRVGSNQSVGWHRYGEVTLSAGAHVLEIGLADGRTQGKADNVGTDLLFGLDLLLLTTSTETPSSTLTNVPRKVAAEIAKQYADKRQADSRRPVCLNLTSGFYEPYRKLPLADYEGYVGACDIVSYDHYPIYGWGKPEWIYQIAEATAALRALAGKDKPVWAILECTDGGQWVRDDMRAPTPTEIRAEVWMAIINGATGIGYFTHVWKPSYSQCRIPQENQDEMRRVNQQITRLAPTILADPLEGVRCESPGDKPVNCTGRMGPDGRRYVFAVNLSRTARDVSFTVPGLEAGKPVQVLDEDRTITAQAGAFSDRFDELAVHLYAY
jgi:hypothetical protein